MTVKAGEIIIGIRVVDESRADMTEYVTREKYDALVREHRAFVDGLTDALNDAGVPAMPSWPDAIAFLVRRAEERCHEPR